MTQRWYDYVRNADENLYYFEDSVPFDFSGNSFATYQAATLNDANSYIDKVPGTIDEVNRTFIPNATNVALINFTMFDTTDVGVYGTAEWIAKAEFPQALIDNYNTKKSSNFLPY